MPQNCNLTLRIVSLGLLISAGVAMTACETEKSRSPLSPSIAGPIEGVTITTPGLVQPSSGNLVRATEPVVLTFTSASSNSERPFWYEIEVATDEAFAQIVHNSGQVTPGHSSPASTEGQSGGQVAAASDPVPGGQERYQLDEPLDADKMYYWHVRAADGANTGPFSETSSFEVFTPVVIGAPGPIFPVGGEVITTAQPAFRVNSAEVTGPATNVKYRFEIARDTGFSNPVAVLTVDAGGSTTIATPGNLAWDKTYYWRVRASATVIVTSPPYNINVLLARPRECDRPRRTRRWAVVRDERVQDSAAAARSAGTHLPDQRGHGVLESADAGRQEPVERGCNRVGHDRVPGGEQLRVQPGDRVAERGDVVGVADLDHVRVALGQQGLLLARGCEGQRPQHGVG